MIKGYWYTNEFLNRMRTLRSVDLKYKSDFLKPSIQSAKILLQSPKYGIIMVQSNNSNFQYCVSNIGLLDIFVEIFCLG